MHVFVASTRHSVRGTGEAVREEREGDGVPREEKEEEEDGWRYPLFIS